MLGNILIAALLVAFIALVVVAHRRAGAARVLLEPDVGPLTHVVIAPLRADRMLGAPRLRVPVRDLVSAEVVELASARKALRTPTVAELLTVSRRRWTRLPGVTAGRFRGPLGVEWWAAHKGPAIRVAVLDPRCVAYVFTAVDHDTALHQLDELARSATRARLEARRTMVDHPDVREIAADWPDEVPAVRRRRAR